VNQTRSEAIGANLANDGSTVIDVKDCIVTPGLIDVHLHLMKGLGAFGVDPMSSASDRVLPPSLTPAARAIVC
jgi:imidazolonepropionase-like amidohydrolase